ncbi:MAG: prepilin peptidase [Gammaproteobacteria bacterium]|nr:prepilin peptidase [Gammaproteobacteria bacterium]
MPLLDLLQSNAPMFIAVMGILGLVVGSFLNVVAYRLPKMLERDWRRECRTLLGVEAQEAEGQDLGLIRPRSRCPACGHPIRAMENVPVFSYIFLRGKCSACGSRISPRYPIIEVTSAILTMVVAWRFGFGPQAASAALLTWSLIALSIIDLDHQYLPDDITLPMLWLGIFCSLLSLGAFVDVKSSLVGAMGGYVLLWLVYKLFKAATGKEGMGYGDFKLLAMLGAWLGWQMLPLIILVSSLCGSIVGIGLILSRRLSRSQPIPFGPYLAVAGWIALLWGGRLTRMLGWAQAQ